MSRFAPWPKATELKPGEFQGSCRMGQVVLTRDMNTAEKAHAEAEGWAQTFGYLRVRGRDERLPAFVRPDCEGLTFTDPKLFEDHLSGVHRKKKASSRTTRPKWRGPKLTENGKPFEPIGLEPGVEITWTEMVGVGPQSHGERITRTGQVWAAAERGTAWVVPYELLEDELCVRLELTKYGDVIHRETRQRKTRSAA